MLASDARLVVTPETALPLFLAYLPADYLGELASHVRQREGGLLNWKALGYPGNPAQPLLK